MTPFDFPPTPQWMADALCQQADPEAWFPDGSGDHGFAAIAICARCPVRSECLDFAIADPHLQGVWGGTTNIERIRMRKEQAA